MVVAVIQWHSFTSATRRCRATSKGQMETGPQRFSNNSTSRIHKYNPNFISKPDPFQAQSFCPPTLNISSFLSKKQRSFRLPERPCFFLVWFTLHTTKTRRNTDTKITDSRQKPTHLISHLSRIFRGIYQMAWSLMMFFSTTTPCIISLLTDHKSEVGPAGRL